MELMDYLTAFDELPMEVTLHKVNKNIIGEDVIELGTRDKLHDYLISPLDVSFLRVETEGFVEKGLFAGDIIIVERKLARTDGLAIVRIDGKLVIQDIMFSEKNDEYEYFGIITYVIRSEEEDFIHMLSEELFFVS